MPEGWWACRNAELANLSQVLNRSPLPERGKLENSLPEHRNQGEVKVKPEAGRCQGAGGLAGWLYGWLAPGGCIKPNVSAFPGPTGEG